MKAENTARRIIVTGRVQGVGFRAFVHSHAETLGLDGFVRNRKDGTVEALVAGDPDKVAGLIAHCHKGPPGARVEKVEIGEAQGIVEKGFRHLPTV